MQESKTHIFNLSLLIPYSIVTSKANTAGPTNIQPRILLAQVETDFEQWT